MDDLASVLNTLVVVGVVAALAPLIVALLPGPRVPQIVLLIIGGIVIGPEGLALADPAALILLANIGLGLVFLLAGYELDPAVFGERAGRLALVGWVITVALAAGLVGVLQAMGFVRAFVPVATRDDWRSLFSWAFSSPAWAGSPRWSHVTIRGGTTDRRRSSLRISSPSEPW